MATKKAASPAPFETLEEATKKGYIGTTPDDTPNEAYTVAGVIAKSHTPETIEPGSEGSTKVDPDAPLKISSARNV
jgi:hypothetical protein